MPSLQNLGFQVCTTMPGLQSLFLQASQSRLGYLAAGGTRPILRGLTSVLACGSGILKCTLVLAGLLLFYDVIQGAAEP